MTKQRRRLDKGLLIAIEGIDGAGKTTQAKRLEELLSPDFFVLRTKEPTDGKWGAKLRQSAQTGRLSPEDELELFIKDRKEHVRDELAPALERGEIVIVDRYYFSNAAYQGARGLDPEQTLRLNEKFAPEPGLVILIEVPPKVGISRIRKRGDKENLFEAEDSLLAVDKVFRAIERKPIWRVDGTLSAEDITAAILDKLYSGPLSSIPGRRAKPEPTDGDLMHELADRKPQKR